MAYTNVLLNIPKKITAGVSISWLISLCDYPASAGWSLTYILVKDGNQIQITSSADGDKHVIEIPFATTASYTPGNYKYQAYVSDDTERYQVGTGDIEIVIDFATQTEGHDGRSKTKIILDALEALLENRASKSQMFQTIGGNQIQHMPLGDIIKHRDKYKFKHIREQAAMGRCKTTRTLKPRFKS